MRSTVSAIVLLLLAVWLQVYFFGGVRPLGILPNVLLVVLTFFALLRPASQALTVALIGGLLLDLSSGTDFGLRMAFYSLFTLAIVFWHQLGATETALTVAASVIVGTVVYNLVLFSSLLLNHIPASPVTAFRLVSLELIVNLLLALVLRRFWGWALRQKPEGGLVGQI